MRLCIHLAAAGLVLLTGTAQAVVEEFDGGAWAHHEELASQVITDDLVITAEGSGSMKGVRDPHALYPGFDPTRPATAVIIEPRNHAYLTLDSIGGTDLFQMDEPLLTVRGFRGGEEVAAQSIGPLWSHASQTGVMALLSGFDSVERVEIRSDEGAPVSDVHFFIESLTYTVTDDVPDPPVTPPAAENGPPPVVDASPPFGEGGAFSVAWLGIMLLISLRRQRRS